MGIIYDSAASPRPAAGHTTVEYDIDLSPPLQMAISQAIRHNDTAYHFQTRGADYTAANPDHQLYQVLSSRCENTHKLLR
ncbi:MAG: hypothetical protein L0154_17680 [Chloroflexi bacterium]|nr:hypothetical protein [Chloroflexota bacterium]